MIQTMKTVAVVLHLRHSKYSGQTYIYFECEHGVVLDNSCYTAADTNINDIVELVLHNYAMHEYYCQGTHLKQ